MTGSRKNAIFKIIASLLLFLALGLVGFVIYLKSNSGQKWVSQKASEYLSKKLKTTVKSNFTYSFPDWIQSENLLIKDELSDTLLSAGKVRIDLDMLALINNKVLINKALLENSYFNIYEKNKKPNYQFILDAFASDTTAKNSSPTPFEYVLKEINLKNSRIKSQAEGNNITLIINSLKTGFDVFDLEKSKFFLKKSEIDGLTLKANILASTDSSKSHVKTHLKIPGLDAKNINLDLSISDRKIVTQNAGIQLAAEKILPGENKYEISDLTILTKTLDLINLKEKKKNNGELDPNNLAINDALFSAKNLKINGLNDAIGHLKTITFKEKSGFQVKNITTDFNLKNNNLVLPKLTILTGKSSLTTKVSVVIDSINPENTKIKLSNLESKIAPSEALFFSKTLEKNENFKSLKNAMVAINGELSGNSTELTTKNLTFILPDKTSLNLAGKISNFSNPMFDFDIKSLKSSRKDIQKYLPPSQLPADLNLPEFFTATGAISGNKSNIHTNLIISSDIGTAKINAALNNLNSNPAYQGKVLFAGFDAGKLIKNPDLGKLNGYVDFNGSNFSNPAVEINGHLKQAVYQDKKYQNIDILANLNDQKVNTSLAIDDQNANITWTGIVDLRNPNISVAGKTKVDFVNLKSLGLTDENIEVKGNFDINELIVDPKNPKIDLSGSNVRIYRNDQLFPLGDLRIFTLNSEQSKALYFNTDFMRLNLTGNFEYDQLSDIILTEINKYFKIPDYKPLESQRNYSFNFNGKINYDPVFTAFLPGLKAFEPITAVTKISSENPLLPISGSISLPSLKYDSLNIKNLNFDFSGNGTALAFKSNTSEILQNDFRIRNASLTGTLENNVADFALSVKDSVEKEIHALHGFVRSENNALQVSFDEEGTRLFYEPWAGNPYGYFEYSKAGIKFSDVIFTNAGSQMVRISTLNNQPNGPLHVFAQNLDLNFFSRAIFRDSTLLSGSLDTDVELVNYLSDSLSFTGEYSVKKLTYLKNQLGDLQGIAKSNSTDEIYLSSELIGSSNEVKMSGSFFPNQNQKIALNLNLNKLNLVVAEPFLADVLYQMKGEMSGNFKVKGTLGIPEITGEALMKTFEGRISQTGALIKMSDQKIMLADKHLSLNNLIMSDKDNQKLKVNGDINLEKMPDFEYSLSLSGKDFKLVDATKGQNELFYGEGFFSPEITIKGKNTTFKVEGDVGVGKKTELTLLMEDESAAGSEMQEIVEFVTSKKTAEKTIKKEKIESKISFANAVNINVDVPNEATLNILMDPLTGDLLSANGNGKFNIGFDNNGELFMLGLYDIEKGKYALTYQVIKKEFEINSTSKSNILWTGNPMAGKMDITASYNVPGKKNPPFRNADNSDIKLNIPVRVDLTLQGPISGPEVNFEVVLKEKDLGQYVKNAEEEGYRLINEKGEKNESASAKKVEMNDRAVFLLVTHSFNSESLKNNFESINNYEDIARRKASELISNSLNNFASGLIKGFDLNFGLESGVNTSNSERNTNLSLGVSKKLANERLVISVGKNFELENKDMRSDEIFDNLQANWLISKDGRYRFNIFRKTQNDMVIEGSVIETGVGFIVAIDYETWKELLKRSK